MSMRAKLKEGIPFSTISGPQPFKFRQEGFCYKADKTLLEDDEINPGSVAFMAEYRKNQDQNKRAEREQARIESLAPEMRAEVERIDTRIDNLEKLIGNLVNLIKPEKKKNSKVETESDPLNEAAKSLGGGEEESEPDKDEIDLGAWVRGEVKLNHMKVRAFISQKYNVQKTKVIDMVEFAIEKGFVTYAQGKESPLLANVKPEDLEGRFEGEGEKPKKAAIE